MNKKTSFLIQDTRTKLKMVSRNPSKWREIYGWTPRSPFRLSPNDPPSVSKWSGWTRFAKLQVWAPKLQQRREIKWNDMNTNVWKRPHIAAKRRPKQAHVFQPMCFAGCCRRCFEPLKRLSKFGETHSLRLRCTGHHAKKHQGLQTLAGNNFRTACVNFFSEIPLALDGQQGLRTLAGDNSNNTVHIQATTA